MDSGTLALLRERARLAIAGRDTVELRRLIEDGATFASLTIQTPTERAEATFERWILAGRPADIAAATGDRYLATSRVARLAAVQALSDVDLWHLAELGSPAAERWFAGHVRGYGPAKASFALACAGIGRLGCIDGRLQRKHGARLAAVAGGRPWEAALRVKAGWTTYLAGLAALWPGPDSAAGQWSEWLDDLAAEGRATSHAVLLEGAS